MASKKDDAIKVTGKRGDLVRVVHRPSENAWKIWESGTNKMVAYTSFASKKAAIEFAEAHSWKVTVVGESRKAGSARHTAATKAPAARKARKGGAAKKAGTRAARKAAAAPSSNGAGSALIPRTDRPVARPTAEAVA